MNERLSRDWDWYRFWYRFGIPLGTIFTFLIIGAVFLAIGFLVPGTIYVKDNQFTVNLSNWLIASKKSMFDSRIIDVISQQRKVGATIVTYWNLGVTGFSFMIFALLMSVVYSCALLTNSEMKWITKVNFFSNAFKRRSSRVNYRKGSGSRAPGNVSVGEIFSYPFIKIGEFFVMIGRGIAYPFVKLGQAISGQRSARNRFKRHNSQRRIPKGNAARFKVRRR